MKFPTVENAALVMIDMQQKLLPAMNDPQVVLERCGMLLNAADTLKLDVLVTEQYPKGLGNTIPAIAETFVPENTSVVAKTSFSVFGEENFRAELEKKYPRTIVFCGVEAHVCVLSSIFDALAAGFNVVVAADAVSSRKESEKLLALESARQAGAWVLSTETILFMLLQNSLNPAFKAVSKLIK